LQSEVRRNKTEIKRSNNIKRVK